MTINISENLSRWLKPAIHTNHFDSAWYKKRVEIIESITDNTKSSEKLDLLRYFFDVLPDERKFEVEGKIQGDDLAYDKSNYFLNKLIIGACLINIINERSFSSDTVSLAYSTYGFRKNSIDSTNEVEADLKRLTLNYLRNESVEVRKVNNTFQKINLSGKKNFNGSKKNLEEGISPTVAYLQKMVDSIFEVATKIHTDYYEKIESIVESYNKEVLSLSQQVEIVKEETNLFWWLFGEFSRDFEKPFSEFSLPFGCLLIGKESADLTEFVPGHPSAKAFIHRALNLLVSKSNGELSPKTQISFASIIEEERQDWENSWLSEEEINKVLDFLPIHRALKCRLEGGKTSWRKLFEAKSTLKTNQKFDALSIAYQFYQERLLIKSVTLNQG